MNKPPFRRSLDDRALLEQALGGFQHARSIGRDEYAETPAPPATDLVRAMSDVELVGKAKAIYAGRRARERVFADFQLFAEPAWDVLLDLFVATLEDRAISVSHATTAAAVPTTTALRWIDHLANRGLVERRPDGVDPGCSFLTLTDLGVRLVAKAVAAS